MATPRAGDCRELTRAGPVPARPVGKGGSLFTLYKFRSMVSDAEAETGPIFASPDAARRTAIGRFMRRLRLYELPQLINIIRGDTSIGGPRPSLLFVVQRFVAETPRYLVPPHARL